MAGKRIDAAIARHAPQETLYDEPLVDRKKHRVSGPFTVEAVPAPAVKSVEELLAGAPQPADAWTAKADQLQRRPRVQPERLDDIFRRRLLRLVKRDRTFSLYGQLWEAPVEVVGCRIEVLCPWDAPEPVEIRYQERSLGRARRVDLQINCQLRRSLRFDQEED